MSGFLGRCNERCSGPSFNRGRGNCVGQFLLQPEQIVCRFDYNARKADVLQRDVVVLEAPAGRLLVGQDLADRVVDFAEIRRVDVALQDRDVWMVGRSQSEALREDLKQAGVNALRVLDHRCVGLQRDVDGCDRVLLRARRLCIAELRSQDAECGHISNGPAQHSFGDVTVQRFSFARDGGILYGQRSDWRWSFQVVGIGELGYCFG